MNVALKRHAQMAANPADHEDTGRKPAALRLRGLEKEFVGNRVLRGVDIDIPAGQFVAIVGKSGCGKSTLLRLLMGLEDKSGGSIEFLDEDANSTEPNSRIVFQEPRLLPWSDVAGNVAVGLGDGVPAAEARLRARAALSEVQLAEKSDEWPSRLSGGQRQRVALARALVSKPDFLALDEPLGALDALTRISMQQLLSRVWREQGFTAVLVTHDVSEAVNLADRVIVLDQGRVKVDLPVPHPHPRKHGTPGLAEIEGQLLAAILGTNAV
jgi:sulfonate transport system ATP-binding protein